MALLSDLPGELIEEIIASLCVKCTPIETRCCYNSMCNCSEMDPVDLTRISALASLCLTSRHLNNMATRHLYHHVHGQRWWLLSRTLLARKDLAQLVRSMHMGVDVGVEEADFPPQVVAYYDSQCTNYLDRLPEDDRAEAISRLSDEGLYSGDGNTQIHILSSLCPNLETLEAIIGYFGAFHFCAPRSMLHLRSIFLSHADTEYGIYLPNVAPLFRAAPNITHALFCMVSSCGELDMRLPNLTSIEFQLSAFDVSSLIEILRSCPNLQTFRYEMGGPTVGYDQFTIGEARDAFLAHAPNLKVLSLKAGDNYNWEEDWDAAQASEMGRVLTERGVQFEFIPFS